MPLTPAKAEFLRRMEIRGSFLAWCLVANPGFVPAKHHLLIIQELEQLVENLFKALVRGYEVPEESLRLMVMTPPGSAKSTYISKLFPPWFLAQYRRLESLLREAKKPIVPLGILACSHSSDYANKWGKMARDVVVGNERWLGVSLRNDSRASDEWSLTNGCSYKAAGVGKGISGERMHLGVIDDFCGQEQEAGSKLFNDGIWLWWENDFVNRLQPISARVIIANHRNEDDLCGRLLAKEAAKWRVVRLRLLIETEEQAVDDPLGRSVGDYLWPEYFTKEQVAERMANPRASGIQQQEPSPEKGGFFTAESIDAGAYDSLSQISVEAQTYAASDHAVSERQTADLTCMGIGKFVGGHLYIHPDIEWERIGSKKAVDAFLRLIRAHKPLWWWAEKGHISKSIGPFLQDRMMDENVFASIIEVTPTKDKMTRAQSIHAMFSMGLVHLPRFAPWFQRARRELLMFPNGKHDDFVDFLAHLGQGVHTMSSPAARKTVAKFVVNRPFHITLADVKRQGAYRNRLHCLSLQDN
jgi:predicted phage terminase large subunit-like protein